MSNISQFGSGGVKSIQRGVISIAVSGTSATATITAVDMAKTELRFLGGSGYDASGTIAAVPRVVLTNTTTVTATLQNANAGAILNVSWELTEFY